jgi:Zn-dependent protease/CBS domain-containing protein
MKWSLKLGQVSGIKIYVHWTFLILVAWIFMVYLGQGQSVAMATRGVALILALFVCVVLHELGHALTAKRYHIMTRDITLLPIGGVARLERIPREPVQELLVAVAGPAVNVAIAMALLVIALILRKPVSVADAFGVHGSFVGKLMSMNLFIVAFNLLPAFPMDGGRILRALLAQAMDYARATAIAARVGQGMAILFFLVGLLSQWVLLMVIAVFVFLGAQAEAEMVQVTASLRGIRVHDAMITHFRALSATDSLSVAVSELIAGSQHDFPVLEGDRVVGMLTRNDLVKALANGGPQTQVSTVMRSDCHTVTENEPLEKSYELLRQHNCSTLPVLSDERRLVGMITLENIAEWIMVNSALRHTAGLAQTSSHSG